MSGWWVALPTVGAALLLAAMGVFVAACYVVVGIGRAIGRRWER